MNDIDEYVGGRISKFADDTKIGWVVNSEFECLGLQEGPGPPMLTLYLRKPANASTFSED